MFEYWQTRVLVEKLNGYQTLRKSGGQVVEKATLILDKIAQLRQSQVRLLQEGDYAGWDNESRERYAEVDRDLAALWHILDELILQVLQSNSGENVNEGEK